MFGDFFVTADGGIKFGKKVGIKRNAVGIKDVRERAEINVKWDYAKKACVEIPPRCGSYTHSLKMRDY